MDTALLPATKTLYDDDPYRTAFTGTVLACEPAADGRFAVVPF